MSDQINIRTKPSRVPMNEFDVSPPSPAKITADLKSAVIQMDSIETSKYKVKEPEPRSPAPLPKAVSPAGIPIDLNDSSSLVDDEEIESKSKEKGEFKIDLGSYEVMDHTVDVSIEGSKPNEYKRNVKGTLLIIVMLLLNLHLISTHCTMFTWVIKYESPDLIMATVLYFISSLCMVFLMMGMLVMPALSTNEEKFSGYYGVVGIAGGLDFVAVMIGGSAFSPVGFYTTDPYSYVTFYWMALFECLVINGGIYYLFTRKSGDEKLFSLFHPFINTKDQEQTDVTESEPTSEIEV